MVGRITFGTTEAVGMLCGKKDFANVIRDYNIIQEHDLGHMNPQKQRLFPGSGQKRYSDTRRVRDMLCFWLCR